MVLCPLFSISVVVRFITPLQQASYAPEVADATYILLSAPLPIHKPNMALLRLAVIFAVQTLLFGLFVNRSPYTMVTTSPSSSKPWVDGPMRLITTPQFETQKVRNITRNSIRSSADLAQTDLFTTGATHMCLLHNSIIRGFNSIYLQAPHVQDADKADFVGYAKTWFRFVKSHHDDEERNLFAKVEDVLNDKDIWAETHEEHGMYPRTVLFIHFCFADSIRILPRRPGGVQHLPKHPPLPIRPLHH